MIRVNLGCPRFCLGWTCVDIRPVERMVVRDDVYDYLSEHVGACDEIRSYNLLEHLPNPGLFLRLCYEALKPGGSIEIRTDNADFNAFYLRVVVPHTGMGAHAENGYAQGMNGSRHFMIFSRLHLENLMEYAGFESVRVRTDWRTLGARYYVVGRAGVGDTKGGAQLPLGQGVTGRMPGA